jgi:hypothetical protein
VKPHPFVKHGPVQLQVPFVQLRFVSLLPGPQGPHSVPVGVGGEAPPTNSVSLSVSILSVSLFKVSFIDFTPEMMN